MSSGGQDSGRPINSEPLRKRGLHTVRDNLGPDQALHVSGKTIFAIFREELLDRLTTRAAAAAETDEGDTGDGPESRGSDR